MSDVMKRLLARIEYVEDCWIWQGSKVRGGYGRIKVTSDRNQYVHRVVFEAMVGAIPPGMELDHLCRNRACCNPAHLETVTHRVNVQRAESFHARKTHCPHGHEYTPVNTLVSCGKRLCRACRRIQSERRKGQRRANEVDAFGRRIATAVAS